MKKYIKSAFLILVLLFLYLPIFILWMKKATDMGVVKRFVIPAFAIAGSLFMVYACIVSHRMENVYFLIVFAVFMAAGALFSKKRA